MPPQNQNFFKSILQRLVTWWHVSSLAAKIGLFAAVAVVAGGLVAGLILMKDHGQSSINLKFPQVSIPGNQQSGTADGTKPTTPGDTSKPGAPTNKPGTGSTGGTTGGGTSTGGTSGGSSGGGGSSGVSCLSGTHVPGGSDGAGGCWPGPNNTGVPAGTVLSAYSGPCTITTDNTVIDSKTINCGLAIHAANVMIKNSKVNGNILVDLDLPNSSGWSLTIQDSEVDAGNSLQSAVSDANVTIIRGNIHGGINGLECDPPMGFCTLQDTYIHGQAFVQNIDTHLGGFLSDGGSNITIKHNTIICDTPVNNVGGGCTGDVNFIPNFAPIDGALIEHNLLGANTNASYCTYGGEKNGSTYPHSYHMVYKDNIFQRGTNNLCAAYGPVTGFAIGNTGNVWTNNKWDNGGFVDPEN